MTDPPEIVDNFPWNDCITQAAHEENHSLFMALSAINDQLVGLRQDLRALLGEEPDGVV